MKRLLTLAAACLIVCCHLGAADKTAAPAQTSPAAERDHQDVVYFAETGPLLVRLHIAVDGRRLPEVWDAYITKVFRHLDTNGDGVLDQTEAQRVPPPAVLFGGANGPNGSPPPALRDLDLNGDGKVGRNELAAYFRRQGYGPFQVASGGDSAIHSYYATIDSIVLNELNFQVDGGVGFTSGRPGRGADSLNDALFKLLDTNGDGKLSKAELLAAPAVLLKRDRNDDEIITPDEITSSKPALQRGSDSILDVYSIDLIDIRSNRRNSDPFRLIAPGESSLELARALQARYTPKEAKALTRAHLGLDAATFAALDVDGNGRLDLEELSRFARRTPDLELQIDLGKKASVELLRRGTAADRHVRTGRDGSLILDIGGTRVDLKGLVAPPADTAQVKRQVREQYVAQFKEADRDKTGYLDMSEAMRSPFFRNTFKLMDRDGDGMLFEKEMLAFLDDFLDLQAAAQASCASVAMTIEGKGLFELLDTNGDGRLSVREMQNAVKLLADLDVTGSGAIARTAIPRCSQMAFRMGPAPTPLAAQYGFVTTLAFTPDGQGLVGGQPRPPQPQRGPEWFRKMDRNGDGDVSRREFLGTDAQFRAIDTDGDGLISVEEAEAYEKKMRAKK